MDSGKDESKKGDEKRLEPQDKSEDCNDASKSGLASGKTSQSNKVLNLLETQGIILGRTLGSGSYAKVKSAYDINKKHKVAVKIINKKRAFEEYLKKFLPREIEAMKIISNHYALVRFYQIIETTSRYFFIMEMAERGDLLSTIKHHTCIAEKQAGIWLIHLHDGLIYMHSKGIVHRDIKCENLVIDEKNTLKLTDFGFAKKIGKMKNGTPLLSETYCGSYAYAPPEILKGLPYDPELSDVWSMGVVLFTMVYGRLPFDDSNLKKLLKQVQTKVVFPGRPEVSEMCRILIIKILSKHSERVPLRNVKADPWFKKHIEYFEPDHPKFQQKSSTNTISQEGESKDKDTGIIAGSEVGGGNSHETAPGGEAAKTGDNSPVVSELEEPTDEIAGPSTREN